MAPSVNPSYLASSEAHITSPGGLVPPSPHRALATEDLSGLVEIYRAAAINAKAAGFDGVELAAGDGYLIDQFLQDGSNSRLDCFGGSIRNRARLLFDIVEVLVAVWGSGCVGVRLTPYGTSNGVSDSNPGALLRYVFDRLNMYDVAYLHVIEQGNGAGLTSYNEYALTKDLRKLFKGTIMLGNNSGTGPADAMISHIKADLVSLGASEIRGYVDHGPPEVATTKEASAA
jgi:N-ethylmaleimide reductase